MTKDKSSISNILLYGYVLQNQSNRVAALEEEKKEIVSTLKNEKLTAHKDRIEIIKMETDLKNIKIAIQREILKKFKNKMDWKCLDQIEMSIIDTMIIKSNSETKDTTERCIRELRILEVIYYALKYPFKIHTILGIDLFQNKISTQQKLLTELNKSNTFKNKLLRNVLRNVNKIRRYLNMDQEKTMVYLYVIYFLVAT